MKRQWTRYALVALFACLLGVLAHASISRAVQGRDPEPKGSRATGARQDNERRDGEKPENTLLRRLWELIDGADDLSSDEKSEAFEILEEADPVLTRIKKENERALERLNRNPPRMVIPKRPVENEAEAPAAEEPAEEENDTPAVPGDEPRQQ